MGFASSPFSAMPGHRLEVGSYILGATADGRITVQRTIGIRRISGPGAVGDLWLAAGTSIVPAGGSIGGTSPYSYDTTANSYNELTSGVSSLTPAEYVGSNIYRVNGRVDTEASPENPLGSAPQTSADAEFPTPSQVTQPSFAPAVFNAGDTITISLPRQNSAYAHTLYWQVGNAQPVYLDGGVGASLVFATPANEILARMTEAPEAKFSIISTTMNGSAIVGEARFEGRVLAPTSAAPTVSAYTVSDANAAASSIVGAFVQGVSTLRLDGVTAAAKDGATIVERRLSIEGAGMAIGDTRALLNSGAIPVVARAWDSRGLSGSLSGSVNVLPYRGPSMSVPFSTPTGSSAYRSNASGAYDPEGAYLAIGYGASVASLVNGTERNTLTLRISTRPIDGETWTVRNTLTPTVSVLDGRLWTGFVTQVVGGGAIYLPDQSYAVRMEVIDKFNTLVKEETVATAYVTIDLNGPNVGVGKLHQRGTLDVAKMAYFEGLSFRDWEVGDLDLVSHGGVYSFSETALNAPPIPSIMGRLVVNRTPLIGGLDIVLQRVVHLLTGENQYCRSGSAIAGQDLVEWDGPWVSTATPLSLRETVYFTSSGTFNKSSYPFMLKAVRVRLVGGGGGGGGAATAATGQNSYGTGGGGGGYAESFFADTTGIPSSVTVTVGSGGGGGQGGNNGSGGGGSSFGSLVAATGGAGGVLKLSSTLGGYLPGGAGGVGTAGDIKIDGSGGTGGAGRDSLGSSGAGGASQLGGGAKDSGTGANAGAITGAPGGNYGGGGGGAVTNSGGTGRWGGDGAPGIVIVELYG